jgi:hypothetical protein
MTEERESLEAALEAAQARVGMLRDALDFAAGRLGILTNWMESLAKARQFATNNDIEYGRLYEQDTRRALAATDAEVSAWLEGVKAEAWRKGRGAAADGLPVAIRALEAIAKVKTGTARMKAKAALETINGDAQEVPQASATTSAGGPQRPSRNPSPQGSWGPHGERLAQEAGITPGALRKWIGHAGSVRALNSGGGAGVWARRFHIVAHAALRALMEPESRGPRREAAAPAILGSRAGNALSSPGDPEEPR